MAPRQGACPGAIPGNRTIFRSDPMPGRVRAKDALHSLWAKEGKRSPGSELWLGRPIQFFNKSRTSLCGRVSKTQPAWGSTRATCQFPKGAWQKSDAPALQAGPSGSVTRRPPAFAPCTAAGEGCRAEVRSTQAGMNRRTSGPRLGKPCRFDCGKLDQSTERSLINFLRWV